MNAKDYQRQWREEHPDYDKRYREEKRDFLSDYGKKWNNDNPEYRRNYYKENKGTPRGKAAYLRANYRNLDRNHGFGVDQTASVEDIAKFIDGNRCIYCGDDNWEHLGLDRIDNTKPHSIDNCVCACGVCNMDRKDRYTVGEFIEYRKTHPRELGRYKRYPTVAMPNGVRALKPKPIKEDLYI